MHHRHRAAQYLHNFMFLFLAPFASAHAGLRWSERRCHGESLRIAACSSRTQVIEDVTEQGGPKHVYTASYDWC